MTKRYHVKTQQSILFVLVLVCSLVIIPGCAYHLGSTGRSLPQGYRQIMIPVFKNLSMEPAIEVSFTNALIKEFERSKIGRIVSPSEAEISIEGVITKIAYKPGGKKDTGLPSGAVLATTYDIDTTVTITVRKRADNQVLWMGEFSRTRSYSAPQVTLPGLNTVNPLYNLSARRQNFDILASDLMAEAHDRLTENF